MCESRRYDNWRCSKGERILFAMGKLSGLILAVVFIPVSRGFRRNRYHEKVKSICTVNFVVLSCPKGFVLSLAVNS